MVLLRYTILFGLAIQLSTAKYLLIEIDEDQEKESESENKGNRLFHLFSINTKLCL